ncbi:MAG: type II toxin-antitoxin system VapC family toxin [Dehalococcoidia bacterium]|nr:type II toxin-antitoxin system VapC family toxin [Dehalococcoidia bacterium]
MYIVDASVWVARFWTRDPRHTEARSWVFETLSRGEEILAPAILLAEVAGPLGRRTGEIELGLTAARQLGNLPGLRLLDIDEQMARLSGELAARLRLKGADAVYVAAAMIENAPLVTLDREQNDRASRMVTAFTPT